MNARKSMGIIGAVVVTAIGSASYTAFAGIDAGGKPEDKDTVSIGRITGFGSIYVNGVRYATDSATFVINGELGSEADLSVGEIVTVYGSADDGSGQAEAWVVLRDDAVEGPVASVDAGAGTMTLMGQTVFVDADTMFDDDIEDLDELETDDIVRVSGHYDSDGNIVATHIGAAAGNDGFELTGLAGSVDTATATLTINELAVDYGAANLFGFAAGVPAAGDRVTVKGSAFDASGRLLASAVSDAGRTVAASAGTDAEIEGFVTANTALGAFELNGIPVRYDWDTEFVDGSIFGLMANQRAEVEGQFDAAGVLVAETIRFARSSDMEVDGTVEFLLGNFVVVDGALVQVTSETAWEDDSSMSDRYLNVSGLRTGDRVYVRGHASGNGVIASQVVRRD